MDFLTSTSQENSSEHPKIPSCTCVSVLAPNPSNKIHPSSWKSYSQPRSICSRSADTRPPCYLTEPHGPRGVVSRRSKQTTSCPGEQRIHVKGWRTKVVHVKLSQPHSASHNQGDKYAGYLRPSDSSVHPTSLQPRLL